MAYQNLEPISKQVTIVIGLTVVGFMAFGLALSFYRNVLFEHTLENMKDQNQILAGTIDNEKRELEYYQSAKYKDKYAKENLGKINPGEKVLIITQKSKQTIIQTETSIEASEQQEAKYFELLRQMPVLEQWNLFLFHKEQVEELKKGI